MSEEELRLARFAALSADDQEAALSAVDDDAPASPEVAAVSLAALRNWWSDRLGVTIYREYAAGHRYAVVGHSPSGHGCCFDATVVDTTKFENGECEAVCECFDDEAAALIAAALNKASAS